MHVTQKEIAHRSSVFCQMVTLALSGGVTVSNQKRRDIEAPEKMGYWRNELPRVVATGESRNLGV